MSLCNLIACQFATATVLLLRQLGSQDSSSVADSPLAREM